MTIEGDYVVFEPAEAAKISRRIEGDEYRYRGGEWHPCGTTDEYQRSAGYTNGGYLIRRPIKHCTPEQLAEAGRSEFQHFL